MPVPVNGEIYGIAQNGRVADLRYGPNQGPVRLYHSAVGGRNGSWMRLLRQFANGFLSMLSDTSSAAPRAQRRVSGSRASHSGPTQSHLILTNQGSPATASHIENAFDGAPIIPNPARFCATP